MIWIAITIQLILSAGLLWATWQIWMLRKSLKATVRTVDGWTEVCQHGLQGSSPNIDVARGSVGSLRSQYKNLQIQLERISKLLSILGRGVSFLGSRWQKARQKPSNLSKKSSGSKSSGREHNVKRRR